MFFSRRLQRRLGATGVCILIIAMIWAIQQAVLSRLLLNHVQCNLALTFTIVWGLTFGSPLLAPSFDEIRLSSLKDVFVRQIFSGSPTGFLVGAAFSALYACFIPVYALSYPIVGWTAGYFCLKNFNQALIVCIPLVLLLTFMSELIMAAQLAVLGRPDVFENLVRISLSEAALNSIIAPCVFFPMRGWSEFVKYRELVESR
ncbi:MAG: rod shape-determining protein MreD [Candidatus Obscuribacterales bacterium]|nr:rod shape-determining protein MreD [Candidatus Obscuribacterales bacterium]